MGIECAHCQKTPEFFYYIAEGRIFCGPECEARHHVVCLDEDEAREVRAVFRGCVTGD